MMAARSSNHGGTNPATNKAMGFADPEWGNVFCRYGIHSGSFPIAGMRVGDVRAILTPLLNIDPTAKAVIKERVLSEDDIIGDGVECLSFVKQSSIMG